jgi:DNA-binding SARP family transcriptional activator
MQAEPLLRIYLFDPVWVQVGDRPPLDEHYPRRKAKALFVYLFLNRGRWISKYELLADLWPDAENADVGRVKHTVQVLRSALEGPRPTGGWQVILERGGSYAFNTAAGRYSDVEAFEEELRAARRARHASEVELARVRYQRAIELHRGPFLADFRYDDWAAFEVARQHELYLDVLEEAAGLESSRGNFPHATELLRLAIALDPLRECSYVELMRTLWLQGRRTDALRVYQRLRDVLARRLDVEPQLQTIRLAEAIRHGQALAS